MVSTAAAIAVMKERLQQPNTLDTSALVAATDAEVASLLRAGALERQLAHYTEAEQLLRRAIDMRHDCGEAHYNLGLIYLEQGELEDAVDSFHLATHFSPQLAAAQLDLAGALSQMARFDEAEAACLRGIELVPESAAAWLRLGNIKKSRGHVEEAIACFTTAVQHDPAHADACCQLAFLLYKLGRYDESRARHDAALALKPDFVEARHNLGLLLLETGYPQESLESFLQALQLRPGTLETMACIAHALRDLGRLQEALACYDAVLAAAPEFGDAVINRCYTILMLGRYAEGWDAYERRFAAAQVAERAFPFPRWQGEPLAGKRLLVYAEQGLGDEIMFASCLPDVVAAGAGLVIETSSRLHTLFGRSFPGAFVHGGSKEDGVEWLARLPKVDYQIAIGSLPARFRRAAESFPKHSGYLQPDPKRVTAWQQRMAALGDGLKVGIAWRAGTLRTRQKLRSMPLEHWASILKQPDCHFVSLQYGDSTAEIAASAAGQGVMVHDYGAELEDVDETVAAISALNLVISVDNTVAHLAGALGRPVWVLLEHACEFRYLRQGASMPWYPSARLFRQSAPRDWKVPVREAAVALAERSGVRRG